MFIRRGESNLVMPSPSVQVARTFPATLGEEEQSYSDKVLTYSPVAYWPLSETSGTNADNLGASGSGADGTYDRDVSTMGPTTGIGDGNTAPVFDATNDEVNLYTTTFSDYWDGDVDDIGNLGSMMAWAKVSGAGVWEDSASRQVLRIRAGSTHWRIKKDNTNNRVEYERDNVLLQKNGVSETGWMFLGFTWNETPDEFLAYYNGSQEGTTQSGLETWNGGGLNSSSCWIGAEATGTTLWSGALAHVAFFSTVLNGAAWADLASV